MSRMTVKPRSDGGLNIEFGVDQEIASRLFRLSANEVRSLHASLAGQAAAMAEAREEELRGALKGLLRILDAVKLSAGLSGSQIDRMNRARALIERQETPHD